MQRRDFIRSTVAAASIGGLLGVEGNVANAQPAAVPGASRGAGRVEGSGLQLSLAAYSFRRELSGKTPAMTLERFVDYCAEQDLQATELTEYYFRDKSPEQLQPVQYPVSFEDFEGLPKAHLAGCRYDFH